ncbi:MAG: GTP 3',8-cyclase MoaA [Chloroflexota bacterium]
MRDAIGRNIDYLRLSLTDRCNLRCRYCMPPEGIAPKSHSDILTYEELLRVLRVAVRAGIRRIRLTGGEPLVRKDVVPFIGRLRQALPEISELTMTTNAVQLAPVAAELKRLGLDRVNISLDTLRPERFAAITGRSEWPAVLAGIEAALQAGLGPVKLNVVAMRGFNDDEFANLARLTSDRPLHVRFIELMPLGPAAEAGAAHNGFISGEDIRRIIADSLGPLTPAASPGGAGPAEYYRLPGAAGTLGFITPISEHFCSACNRLRLSADGHIEPCLAATDQYDLRGPLRAGAGDDELYAIFAAAVTGKPREHHMERDDERWRQMSRIGG